MLVFRGSQKCSRKSIDEIRKKDAEELAEELDINNKQCPRRDFTKVPCSNQLQNYPRNCMCVFA